MIFGAGQGQGESETGRLEAFSDGVLAVIITIMALELKAPEGGEWGDLKARLPALLFYILSFTFVGNLLEQPPSPAARRPPGNRRGDVGQPAPAVLAVAHPGADRVGRRAPHQDRPGRDLRDRGPGLGGGLHDPGPGDHPRRRQLLAGRDRDRQRHQGPHLAAGLRGRDRAGVRVPVDRLRPVRRGGGDVVHPRPPPQPGEHGRRYLSRRSGRQRGPASPRCSGPGPASGASRGPARRRGTRAARTPGPAAASPRP